MKDILKGGLFGAVVFIFAVAVSVIIKVLESISPFYAFVFVGTATVVFFAFGWAKGGRLG